MFFEVLGAAIVVMLASLVGIVFVQKSAHDFLEKRLSFLVSFSAGVFLVTAGALGLEVFELVSSLWHGVALIGLGYVLAWALNTFMPETHHHHDAECAATKNSARKLIVGDAIHNVADGVILVVAFSAAPALGIAATVSVVIHESLQEISEFFVFRQAGYSIKKALIVNFAVSSTILIGVILGYFALASHTLEILLLAVSAGFFLNVVIHDLLPKPHQHETTGGFLKHLALVLVGALLMGSVASALGDSHAHGEEGHEGETAEEHALHEEESEHAH